MRTIIVLHLLAAVVGAMSAVEKREMEVVFEIMWSEKPREIKCSFDENKVEFKAHITDAL